MKRLNKILTSIIDKAIASNFKSDDISDLLRFLPLQVAKKIPISKIRGLFLKLISYLIKYKPSLVRLFIRKTGYVYPQGQALFIRGQVNLLKSNSTLGNLELCETIASWLIENRNKDFDNNCWGQPFLWYSRKPFPPNLPRATVTSQVSWAFLDLYTLTGDEKYLEVAKSACKFFIENLNYTKDKNGNYCFSYTTIDNYHIHNASLLAASVLMRVGTLCKIDEFIEAAHAATRFSISHQNQDGSWYYWAPPDKLLYKIDNYHTGFNLEALHTIYIDSKAPEYLQSYKLGLAYYYANLFKGGMPKITNKNTFPIDIQGCAQSIITFALAKDIAIEYGDKAQEILEYTLDNFYLAEKEHFAYRIYENGFLDTSYYFRWGDAWMIRAMSLMIE